MRPTVIMYQRACRGFTLVEMMVSLLVGILISTATIAAYVSHGRTIYQQIGYSEAGEDVSEAYVLLSRLIRQAQRNTINISGVTTVGNCTSNITIDLAVPGGFPIWPNTQSPFDHNWIRLVLSDTGAHAHAITIAKAVEGGLGSAAAVPFAGSNSGNNTRITCLSLVKQADETYVFSVAGYARNFIDGDVTFEGVIMPRN